MAIASIFFGVQNAHAVESINVQTFNPSTSDHFVLIEDGFKSEWPKTAKYYFGVNYNYVSEPLVALDSSGSYKAYDIINSIQTLDLMFGFKPSPKFGLFFGVPIHYIGFPDAPAAGFPTGSNTAFGDLKLLAKIRLTDETSATSVALIPEFHLPTGSTENFVSDASTYVGGRLAIEHTYNNFTLAGNLGFATASNSIYQIASPAEGIDYRRRFMFGLGGFMPFNDTLGMNMEFSSIHMLPFNNTLNPNELYVGLRDVANENLILTLGASLGRIGGVGGQTYRVIAGLRCTLYEEEKQAPVVYSPPPVVPVKPMPAPRPIIVAKAMPTPVAPAPVVAVPVTSTAKPQAILQAKRIELLTPINFEEGSTQLTYESKGVLDEVADVMKKNHAAYKKILIDGHTNKIGGDKYNLKLSLNRAKAVKSYLMKKGIPAKDLQARGFGLRKPKISYSEVNAMEINRRVEFIVVK